MVGTGLGTIFRYFSYKKWVFLAHAPGTAVAAGEAALSGIVDPAETSPSGAALAGVSGSYGPPWEHTPREPRDDGYGPPWQDRGRPAGHRYGPPSEHLDPADSDASHR